MSSNEKEVADEFSDEKKENIKKFLELQQMQKRSADDEIEYQRLLSLVGKEILSNPTLLKGLENTEVNYSLVKNDTIKGLQKKDLDALLKAYESQTGRSPIQDGDGTSLSFSSQAEAVAFFQDQAKQGLAFDMYCAAQDHRVYSDGQGNFVQGTHKEVGDYLKNPDNYEINEDGSLEKKEDLENTSETQFQINT